MQQRRLSQRCLVIAHSALPFFAASLFAPSLFAAEPVAAGPRHATPAEAFDAFRAAAQKEDWQTALKSCATRLQDHLIVSNVRIGYRIADYGDQHHKPGFEALLRRHVPRLDEWKQELRTKATAENREPLAAELAAKIRDNAADKPALLAELFAWLGKLGVDHGLPAGGVVDAQLSNLAIDGQRAKAVALSKDEKGTIEFPIEFIREAHGWRLMLPEL